MPETQETPKSPMELLMSLPGAPSEAEVAAWKSEVPNGQLRLFSPDGRRMFIMRGITGIEMAELQNLVPPNASNPEVEFKQQAVARACVFTNTSINKKLDPMILRTLTAGLPESLFALVENLSDYFSPAQLMEMCVDL